MDLRAPATVLQFSANLDTRDKNDKIRSFVISYYVEEKAFSVFERVVPNSGFNGGKFLQKMVCNDPKTGKPYEPKDVYIGARVTLDGFDFILQQASEASLKAMETRSDVFIKCDLDLIIGKMREMLRGKLEALEKDFNAADKSKRERVTFEDLISILKNYGIVMGDQELLTLFRRYQFGGTELFNFREFLNNLH